MKKVLTVIDGGRFPQEVFEFIDQTHMADRILLTAVFLQSIDYSMVWNYPLYLSSYGPTLAVQQDQVAKNVAIFKAKCEQYGIEYRIHDSHGEGALELLRIETRFSDLLIMAGDFYANDTYYIDPESYLKDTLHEAECPVLLLPKQISSPSKNILAFDGSASSIFAIKQFVMLFPEWSNNETHLVYATSKNREIPDHAYIEEYAPRHFTNLIVDELRFDPKKYFSTWLADEKDSVLVTGAFDRSALSDFFRKSFATDVVNDNKTLVFVAHK